MIGPSLFLAYFKILKINFTIFVVQYNNFLEYNTTKLFPVLSFQIWPFLDAVVAVSHYEEEQLPLVSWDLLVHILHFLCDSSKITTPFLDLFQTGAITAIIFLTLALIFVEDIASFVIRFMEQIIDFPRATGTRHLPKEDQDKEKQKLHEFLVYGETVLHSFMITLIIYKIYSFFCDFNSLQYLCLCTCSSGRNSWRNIGWTACLGCC